MVKRFVEISSLPDARENNVIGCELQTRDSSVVPKAPSLCYSFEGK
jgi:hypothetical protein